MKYKVGMRLKRVREAGIHPFVRQCDGVVIRKVTSDNVYLTDGTVWTLGYMDAKFKSAKTIYLGGE